LKEDDEGSQFENLIVEHLPKMHSFPAKMKEHSGIIMAGHLFKWIHFQRDYEEENRDLSYFYDTDKRKLDFITTRNNKPLKAIECKLKVKEISPYLKYSKAKFPDTECLQVHLKHKNEYISKEGIKSIT